MKILLTGSNGYIGKRLLKTLATQGHHIVCCVRDKKRFPQDILNKHANISLLEVDFLQKPTPADIVIDIDAAYYLIHSMSDDTRDFENLEQKCAMNFLELIQGTSVQQIIYLGGIANDETLSKHLKSRKNVEDILRSGQIPLTCLKAGIIVGSGSSSFEIIRDLVEKLPMMITPKWVTTKTQPIAIRNVLQYLSGVLLNEQTYGNSYDIGGPNVMTYRQMMMEFAEVRGLIRQIYTIPLMSPKISSYWLYFVTRTSYKLATNLVSSMKVEVIAKKNDLAEILNIEPISYKNAVSMAFQKIEQNDVISSWKDSFISSYTDNALLENIKVPTFGCFKDERVKTISKNPAEVLDNIWSIGGERGWYYGNFLWQIRGVLDKISGGVGLRRGRTNANEINIGDTLDFWRVLAADKNNKRLLLYAEMKLPGEAWLEFSIKDSGGEPIFIQTATFRPKGILGRLYWYAVLPFHYFVFEGMANNLINYSEGKASK
ncbi:MAG: SDR family oxidoreductase [Saprospiraceae bacterium]